MFFVGVIVVVFEVLLLYCVGVAFVVFSKILGCVIEKLLVMV